MPTKAVAAALRVGGFVPFSSTDYPDRLAAVVFCQGCPWRCRYCHNPHLIPATGPDERDFARILDWLATRRGLLDAVVFSGGEPTAQPALVDAVAAVRGLGFAVGLHTAGVYPRRLAQLLSQLDWVGIDAKAPVEGYAELAGAATAGIAAMASLDLVMTSGVAYEVRTTVHVDLTPPEALAALASELAARGVREWVLQPFRATGCADSELVASAVHGASLPPELLERLRAHVPRIAIRG